MQKQLYPFDHVEDSLESHLHRHSRRSQVVYVAVVAILVAALAALPVVRVGVSVQSSGIIRPVTEKHEVKAQTSGFAEALAVREGERVERGQVLLSLRAVLLEEQLSLLASRLEQSRGFLHDLELLVGGSVAEGLPLEGFRSGKYRQEYVQFANELREIESREEKALREVERARALADRDLAPRSEAEDREFELSQTRSDRRLLVERHQSAWQSALTSGRMELEELLAQRGEIEEEKALYTVVAPVTGTVEQLASISAGSFVQGGEQLAVISPLSELVAEVYVTPRDIGLLREGTPVRVLVDAFNYNDWGFLTGEVREISDDFVMMNEQPVFRVGVGLDRTHLALKNGFRGNLKQGMTLQARFMVTERTLFQLLRDDINDWLNPVGPA
jgi:membrane fusion protein, peptide pheromone/bacteriocin exporter